MVRRMSGALLLLLSLAALCGRLYAQTGEVQQWKTITVRVLDSRTGEPVSPNMLMVRINERKANHSNWVQQNDDGSATVRIPADASLLLVQATYDNSTEIYINCDAALEKNTSSEHWYKVSEMLTSGVVAPDECKQSRHHEAPKVAAKPGEFVFFVRKRNWREDD
jgi:hypothetical protein